MNSEEVMKVFVIVMSLLGMGIIWPQYTYRLKKIIENLTFKIKDILFFLVFSFTLILLFFISQKIGVAHIFKTTLIYKVIMNMNIFLTIFSILILIMACSIIHIYSFDILKQLQNKISVTKNMFKFVVIAFVLGVTIFLITLLCYRFLPILNF